MGRIEFTDQIMGFGTDQRTLKVLFSRQAAEYRVSPSLGDFAELVARLAAAWAHQGEATVTVEGTEIVAVTPVSS